MRIFLRGGHALPRPSRHRLPSGVPNQCLPSRFQGDAECAAGHQAITVNLLAPEVAGPGACLRITCADVFMSGDAATVGRFRRNARNSAACSAYYTSGIAESSSEILHSPSVMIIPSPTIKPAPEVQAGCWSGFKQSILKKKSTPRSKLPPGGLTVDQGTAQPQLVRTQQRCVGE